MKLKDNSALKFQDATMANILCAYVTIKVHPTIRVQEFEMHVLDEPLYKQGYALHQLLETYRNQEELRCFLEAYLRRLTGFSMRSNASSNCSYAAAYEILI
jgi:hypothetical protein